jgi:hypothetical protein
VLPPPHPFDLNGSRCSHRSPLMLPANSVQGATNTTLPRNQYGDSIFLVKVQNSIQTMADLSRHPDSPQLFRGPLLVNDKARSLVFDFSSELCPEAHDLLASRLRREGAKSELTPTGRTLYVRARREAAHLRVFVGDLPDQRLGW